MSLIRRIPEGGFYPGKWYGAAWDEWQMDGTVKVVCLPIPLNFIAKIVHGVWLRLQHGCPWRAWGASYVCRVCRKRSIHDDRRS